MLLCQPLSQDIVLLPEPLPVVGASVDGVDAVKPLDKKELDQRITQMLQQACTEASAPDLTPADPKNLVLHTTDDENVLRTEGSIYMIDKITDDLYFTKSDEAIAPLWDQKYPVLSISNLLLGQINEPKFQIDLTHRCYGTEHPQMLISWNSLYQAIHTPGARTYASGLIQADGKEVRGVWVIHQPKGNYLHMLVVTTPIENLFAPEADRQPLKGDLFTNIPQHNILNLYE